MTVQVTGRNIDAGEAFQEYINGRVGEVLEKYVGPELGGHVRIEKERGRFHTDCTIQLHTGLLLQAHGEGADAYASAEAALERLEKRVRRYKRRLKDHHGAGRGERAFDLARDYTVQAPRDEDDAAPPETGPVIIAETAKPYREMRVSDAVMQLDLVEDPVIVFRNAAHGGLNMVYRRADGNIGWIDPSASNEKTASATDNDT
ncbi:MAG: ribosome-associated translation inhibitor RaiA [Pseudomonadota bacterium]